MGYLRSFVPYFAGIANPLNELKRIGFKGLLPLKQKRDRYIIAFSFPFKAPPISFNVKPENLEIEIIKRNNR